MSESPIDTTVPKTRREKRSSKRKGGGPLEFLLILIISFALVFGVVRPFIVESFWIPSESMVPTLDVGDRVLANKFIYRFTSPQRGDIVVFKSVETPDEDLIKRVVGVPGDTITVQSGVLFVNGKPQKEPYVDQQYPDMSFFGPLTVPPGHIFVMGDNRANSRDSRFFGPVPDQNIVGKAFLRYWPVNRIGLL